MSTTNIHSDPLMSPTRLSNDDVTLSSTATSTWTQNALSINNEHDLMADMTKPITEQNLNQMNMASDMLDSSANGLSLANLTSADQTSPHSPLSISVSLPSDITVSLPSEAELPTAGLNLVDKPTVESTGILPLASTTDSAILPLVSTVDTAMDSTGILPLASSTDPAILPLVTTADSVITSNDLPMPAPMVETTGVSENPSAVTDNAIQATSLAVPTSSNILSPRLLSPSLQVEPTGQPIRTQRIALDNSYKVPKISLLLDNGLVPKPPPRPPQLPLDQLYPPTPSITIENRREAVSPALRNFCIDKRNPVTVIKGMCKALKLDLSMFTTRRLVEQNPEHPMEIRHQRQQPPDENWDDIGEKRVWNCKSSKSKMTIARYAQYQASTYQDSLKPIEPEKDPTPAPAAAPTDSTETPNPPPKVKTKKKFKMIKFGTNVDLSDTKKWKTQLAELTKLPVFIPRML